jgi:MFS family permease
MVVTPSLIFYVLECGGTKEFCESTLKKKDQCLKNRYLSSLHLSLCLSSVDGLALSAFSFASFCGKPALGYWIDATGGKFRKPYFASITLAGCGGLLYFLASAFEEKPGIATHLILWGRLLGGFGAANQALGFAYLAIAIPPEKQTQTSSILSMTRILGMAVGPAFNVLLAKVHGSISLGGYSIVLTPLNTVGIFLAAANLVGMIVIFFLLDEPPERKKPQITGDGVNGENNNWMKLKAFCCIDILLPLYTVFVINSSFQLYVCYLSDLSRRAVLTINLVSQWLSLSYHSELKLRLHLLPVMLWDGVLSKLRAYWVVRLSLFSHS